MARSKENLKKFRSDIATLKKKGLLTGVDARSATPTRRLKSLISKYDNVLSGKATPVKLSAAGVKEYAALGKPYEIARPKGLPQKVIIPHDAIEKVTVSHGKVKISNPAGIDRTVIPVKFHNLPQYFRDLRKKKPSLKEGEYFAFRFFGNRSHRVFRSIDALVTTLEHYESVFDSIEEDDAEQMAEVYQNLEIITVKDKGEWTRPVPAKRPWHPGSNAKRRANDANAPDWKVAQRRAANAARQRQFRANMSAAEKVKYDKAGKKRAKKSAKKRKAATKKAKKK